MTRIYAFPGQGSQSKGMGAELFDLFPREVDQADQILGYSIRALCEEDRDNQLRLTQFTQPSLYTVSCLTYLKTLKDGKTPPDFLIGHSLGELTALFAAGAFSFADGLKIVKKRGELMSRASGGGMAAVLGFPLDKVEALLQQGGFENLAVANYNATTQTILSGAVADIIRADALFSNAGAKFVPLNVSAAFHSRLMEPARQEFAEYIQHFDMQPLNIPVLSNVTAQPYPRQNYRDLIVEQITHPVRWLEIISRLNKEDDPQFEELGPGTVLSKLYFNIKENPAPVNKLTCRYSEHIPVSPLPTHAKQPQKTIARLLMFGGPGSHFFQMGKVLYQENLIFRTTMNECAEMAHPVIGANFAREVYDAANPYAVFDSTIYALPAVFAVSFALYRLLQDAGMDADAFLGYGLGEITAWAATGVLTMEQAVTLVANLAVLAEHRTPPTQGLLVLSEENEIAKKSPTFKRCEVSARNYARNRVLTGKREDITQLKADLKSQAIAAQELPLSRGFHSSFLDAIKNDFERMCVELNYGVAVAPVYSVAAGDWMDKPSAEHLWSTVRTPIDFSDPKPLRAADIRHWVDLTPSGSLANFIKYGSDGKIKPQVLLTPFGHSLPFQPVTSKRTA